MWSGHVCKKKMKWLQQRLSKRVARERVVWKKSRGYKRSGVARTGLSVPIPPHPRVQRRMYSSGGNMAAAPTSVVVLDRGNNTTCTINLHGKAISLFFPFSPYFPVYQIAIASSSLFFLSHSFFPPRWRFGSGWVLVFFVHLEIARPFSFFHAGLVGGARVGLEPAYKKKTSRN